jgi:DNA repair exonuclease SbcCD ATPase subunit
MNKDILDSEHLQKLNQILDGIQQQNEKQNQGIIQLRKELQLVQQQNQELAILQQKNEQQNQELHSLKHKNEELKRQIDDLKNKTNVLSNTQQTLKSLNQTQTQSSIKSEKQDTSSNIKKEFDSLPDNVTSLFPIEIPFSSLDKLNGIFGWFSINKLDLSTFIELIPSSTDIGSIQNILNESNSW